MQILGLNEALDQLSNAMECVEEREYSCIENSFEIAGQRIKW